MKKILKFIFTLPFLAGCQNISQKPQAPVQSGWTVKNSYMKLENQVNLPYVAWWKQFNDPVLNQFLSKGMEQNNQLNMSKSRIEAAEGELKKVNFQWIPDLFLLFGYASTPAAGFPGVLALLGANYTMNIFSEVSQQAKVKYELEAARAEDNLLKLTIISEITTSYFTYSAEVERKELFKILAQDENHMADIANRVFTGGLRPKMEVEELRSDVEVIRGEEEVIEQNIVASRDALHYLMNENPGNINLFKKFKDIEYVRKTPGALPMTVLERRPDMQMAENQLRAANKGIHMAIGPLLPTIQLDYLGGPTGGNSSYSFPTPLFKNAVNFNDQLINVPVLKASQLGEIAKARGLKKESYYHYLDTLQKALRDVTNAISANARLTNKLHRSEEAESHRRKDYDLNRRLYHRGIISYEEMLQSKIAWDKSRLLVNQDKLQQLLTVVHLYQELAGGYQVADSLPGKPKC